MVPRDSAAIAAQRRAAELFELPFAADAVVVQRDPDGLPPTAQRAVYDQAVETDHAARRRLRPADGRDPGHEHAWGWCRRPASRRPRRSPISDSRATCRWSTGSPRPTATPTGRRNDPDAAVVGVTGAQPAELHEGRLVDSSLERIEIATVLLILLIVGVLFRSAVAPLAVIGVAGLAYISALALLRWLGEHERAVAAGEPAAADDRARPGHRHRLLHLLPERRALAAARRRGAARRRARGDGRHHADRAGQRLDPGSRAWPGCGSRASASSATSGPGLAVTVVVAVAASLLVMPAVIAIAGRALFWPRRLEPGVDADEQQSGRVARFATRKPVALADRGRLRRRPRLCGVPGHRSAAGFHTDPRAAVVGGRAARGRRRGEGLRARA